MNTFTFEDQDDAALGGIENLRGFALNRFSGAGLHLAWNLSTLVGFDYAWRSEDQAFYMDIGHQF